MAGIFAQTGDGWISLKDAGFDAESEFQQLVRENLNLLEESGISDDGSLDLLLVKEEAPIPEAPDAGASLWLDMLLVDRDGIPTFVELKRKSDTRLRREVVAQMLDYAAFGTAHWNTESIRNFLEDTHRDCEAAILEFMGPDADPPKFLEQIQTNLQAGRVRLLLVADRIPVELQRIVEFLNSQMEVAEILAVELHLFEKDGVRTIVPRVFGRSELLSGRKTARGRYWDEVSFLEALSEKFDQQIVDAAKKVIEEVVQADLSIRWGRGMKYGSASIGKNQIWPVVLNTSGSFTIQSGELIGGKKLRDAAAEEQWVGLVNNIAGIELPTDRANRWPSFDMKLLVSEANRAKLIASIDYAVKAKKA